MATVTQTAPRSAQRRGGTRPRIDSRLATFLFVLVLLIAWQLTASLGGLGAVPTPIEIGAALVDIFGRGAVYEPLAETMVSWAISFVLASVIGIAVGMLLGSSRLAYRLSVFVLDFCRTIPALALVPLAVLMLGANLSGTVFLAFFGSVWATLLQTIYGVRDVDPVARDTFRSFRIGPGRRLISLVIPSAAPYIATGVRLAAAACLLLTLSTQIVMPAGGIGEAIVVAQLGGAIAQMYAYIVLSGLLGVVINAIFIWCERRLLSWHPSHREVAR